MRKILFRGKRLDNGEWVYGYYAVHHITLTDIDRETNQIIRVGTRTSHAIFNDERKDESGYWKDVDPETVGQFTGLLDKNGKEIYEGDIFGIPQELPNRHIRVVEFIDDGFFLIDNCDGRKYGGRLKKEISTDTNYAGIAKSLAGIGFDYELIGNIHDNPELLKGGQE